MGELDFNVLLTAHCHFRTRVGEREREREAQCHFRTSVGERQRQTDRDREADRQADRVRKRSFRNSVCIQAYNQQISQ